MKKIVVMMILALFTTGEIQAVVLPGTYQCNSLLGVFSLKLTVTGDVKQSSSFGGMPVIVRGEWRPSGMDEAIVLLYHPDKTLKYVLEEKGNNKYTLDSYDGMSQALGMSTVCKKGGTHQNNNSNDEPLSTLTYGDFSPNMSMIGFDDSSDSATIELFSGDAKCQINVTRAGKVAKGKCKYMINSKGIKIYCTPNKKMCKTHKEVYDFAFSMRIQGGS